MDTRNKGCLIWILVLIGTLVYLFLSVPLDIIIERGKEMYGIISLILLVLVYLFLTEILNWDKKSLIIIVLVAVFILLTLLQLWCDLTVLYIVMGIIFVVVIGVLVVGFYYMMIH